MNDYSDENMRYGQDDFECDADGLVGMPDLVTCPLCGEIAVPHADYPGEYLCQNIGCLQYKAFRKAVAA